MSLSEKLLTIANNTSKVYNAGYEKGLAESGGGVTGDPYEVINAIINTTITEFYTEETFGASIQSFGYLFNQCSNLVKWAMPNYDKTYPGYMFRYCNALKYIDIGKPTETHNALFYGRQLKGLNVVIRAENPPKLSAEFVGTSFDTTTSIYVPKNSIDLYKAATNWTIYSDCYKAIEDYPEITGGII